MRVILDSAGDGVLPPAWEVLKTADEPHVLLKLFYNGNHPDVLASKADPDHVPHCSYGSEMDEGLLIPVSTIEAMVWIANRYKLPPLETASPSCAHDNKEGAHMSEEPITFEGAPITWDRPEVRIDLSDWQKADTKFVMATDGRWSVDKDYKRQQTIVTLRIPFTEGVGEDERGVRKLISERLGEIGDVLMNLWRKGKEKTDGSQDSGEDG